MKQPTSLFNKSVFKSDFKRFWWVLALYTIFISVTCLLPFYISSNMRIYGEVITENIREFSASTLLSSSGAAYLILAIIPVGLSVLLFSYLNSKSAVSTLHAIPVKRKTLFLTHSAFGALSLIVPIILNALILILMRTNPNIWQVMSLSHIFWWAVSQIAYALVVFSFSCLLGMLTANSVAHLCFTYIFAFLPLVLELCINTLMNMHLYGYYPYLNGTIVSFTQKILYFDVEKMGTWLYPSLYVVYALVFLAVSYLIYKARSLENTAEVVAFPKLKPVFIYGVGMCMGVLGYFYLNAIMEIESLLWILPFGVLGLIIANMIAKKTLTLKGLVRPVMVLVLSTIALVCIFQFDLFGYETRIPDISEIESVNVTEMPVGDILRERTYDGGKTIKRDSYIAEFKDENDIKNILKLHEYKIENRQDGKSMLDPIFIKYNLKNGRTFTRQYLVNCIEDKALLESVINSKEYKKMKFPITRSGTENIISVSVADNRFGGAFGTYIAENRTDTETISKIINALSLDLKNAKYDEFACEESTLTEIAVQVKDLWYYKGTDILLTSKDRYGGFIDSYTYYVRTTYKNTIKVLDELGLYEQIPKSEDYVSAKIRVFDNLIHGKNKVVRTDRYEDNVIEITDRKTIDELYDYVVNVPTNRYEAMRSEDGYMSFDITFVDSRGYSFKADRTSYDKELPKVLADLLK